MKGVLQKYHLHIFHLSVYRPFDTKFLLGPGSLMPTVVVARVHFPFFMSHVVIVFIVVWFNLHFRCNKDY